MSLLNFNFAVIYIIHEILVLLKNHLNCLKDNTFECFFKQYNRPILKRKKFMTYNDKNPRHEEEKIIEYVRNIF